MPTKAQAQCDAILCAIASLKTATSYDILREIITIDCFIGSHEMHECLAQLCRDGILKEKGRRKLTDKIVLAMLDAMVSDDPDQFAKIDKATGPTYSLTPRGWRALHVRLITYLMRPKRTTDRPWIKRLAQAIEDGTEEFIDDPANTKKAASTKKKPKTSARSR